MADKAICGAVSNLDLDPTLKAYLKTTETEGKEKVLLSKSEVVAYIEDEEILPSDKIKNLKALLEIDESSPACGVFGKQAMKVLTGNGFVIPKEAKALGFDTMYFYSNGYKTFGIRIPCGKVFVPDTDSDNPTPNMFERVEWDAKRTTLIVESKKDLYECRCDIQKNEVTLVELDKKTRKEKSKETRPYFITPENYEAADWLTKSSDIAANFSAAELREMYDIPEWLEIREVKNANGVVGIILRSKDRRIIGSAINSGPTSEVLLERYRHQSKVDAWGLDGDVASPEMFFDNFKGIGYAIKHFILVCINQKARENPVNIKVAGKIVKAFKSPDHEGKYLFLSQMGGQLIYDPSSKKMSLGLGWEGSRYEKATLKNKDGVLTVEVEYLNLRGAVIDVLKYKIYWLENADNSFFDEVVR